MEYGLILLAFAVGIIVGIVSVIPVSKRLNREAEEAWKEASELRKEAMNMLNKAQALLNEADGGTMDI